MLAARNSSFCLRVLFAATFTLAGCSAGLASGNANSQPPQGQPVASGRVMGGQQPIAGASITLWQVNTNGSAATSMLINPVTTDSNGNFSITGDYPNSNTTCAASTQVYIMATGGNPGLSGGTNNGSLALMAALGSCTALQTTSFITINEVTTVASVFALQQFIGVSEGTPFAEDIAVGPNSQSATGMVNAFATVPNLVSIATGTANTTVGNATLEASKLNTIANIIAYCVNSNGGAPCTSLSEIVTPPGSISAGDTIQAALYMAQNPSSSLAGLFALQPSTPPFSPYLATAPFDWSLSVTYTGDSLNLPNLLASDANGNIWITGQASSNAENLVELTPNGTPATGSPFLSGANVAFDGPQSVVPDTLGNIWISSHSSNPTTGNRLVTFNPTTKVGTAHSGLPSGCNPYAVSIDGQDNVFFACSALGYLYEFPNLTSGTPSQTNLPTYAVSPTRLGPLGTESYGMAIDSSDNVWVANTTTSTSPSITEYAVGNYGTVANTFTLGSGPIGIAIDHNNNVWETRGSVLDEFAYKSGSGWITSDYTDAGLNSVGYLAIDGNGNNWIVNRSLADINGTYYATISEFNNNGLPLTQGVSVAQPGGLATATTATDASPRGITIDPSGNVWIAGCGVSTSCSSGTTSFVIEYVGVASPPIVPLATAIAGNQLGCCSFTPTPPSGTAPTDTAGNVSLQASSFSPTQDNGQFSFEITRSGGFKGAISVNYSFVNGTAINGTDFSGTNGTLTWADGDSSIKTISVNWLPTNTYTGTKTFTVSLSCSSACPATFNPYQSELVTVTDNLTPPSNLYNFNNSSSYFAASLNIPIDSYGGTGGINGA